MLCRSTPSAKNNFRNIFGILALAVALAVAGLSTPAMAQDVTNPSVMAAARADVAKATNIFAIPAKKLFGVMNTPADLRPAAIGSYARGCLAGGVELPITGDAWQVMRLSRNRNWGAPQLVALVEDLAEKAKAAGEWNGLMVGDMSQPRGGPMITGHASHQIGLDADVWLIPMPDHVLSSKERETMSAILMTKNRKELDRRVWTENQAKLIHRAALYPQVARIFVHPPIKAELCRWATGDRSWLAKVRPLYGHNYHFHIRMKCPAGMPGCKNQWTPNPKDGTGCGEELAYWMGDMPWKPKKRDPNAPKPKPVPPLTLSGLPAECRAVVEAP